MAIRNFIQKGSYARIERIDYCKHTKSCQVSLHVYLDETCSALIIPPIAFSVSGVHTAEKIHYVITDEKDYLKDATEFPKINNGENAWVNIRNPVDPAAQQFNGCVVTKTPDGVVGFTLPTYIDVAGEILGINNYGVYEVLSDTDVRTSEQFSKLFDSCATHEEAMYKVIMSTPAFKGAVSDD